LADQSNAESLEINFFPPLGEVQASDELRLVVGFAEFLEKLGQFFARVGFLDFFDFGTSQRIAAFVLRMSGMTLEPLPLNAVRLGSGIEAAPEVGIFNRLATGC
jgi:hypothetical protein